MTSDGVKSSSLLPRMGHQLLAWRLGQVTESWVEQRKGSLDNLEVDLNKVWYRPVKNGREAYQHCEQLTRINKVDHIGYYSSFHYSMENQKTKT